MYENLYALTDPGGWYAVDERSPEPHRGEHEDRMPDAARELAEAGAAYAEQPRGGRRGRTRRSRATRRRAESRATAEREDGDEREDRRSGGDERRAATGAVNAEEAED